MRGQLTALFPRLKPADLLIGLEFAGHHGYTFAHFLALKGYTVVTVPLEYTFFLVAR